MQRWLAQPFVRYALALMTGIVLYRYFPASPNGREVAGGFLALVLGCAFYIIIFVCSKNINLVAGSTGLVLLSILGWLVAAGHDAGRAKTHLKTQAPIQGYRAIVQSQPELRRRSFRLQLAVEAVRTEEGWHPATGAVLVYLDRETKSRPRYGERWLVVGAPLPVEGPRNPGQFDYRAFLANQQIFHRQYLKAEQRLVIGYDPPSRLAAIAYRLNARADSVYAQYLGRGEEFAIVKAMILGIRDAIDPDLQQAYSAAGAVHVLSVSGLHVGVLFWVLQQVLGFLRRRKNGRVFFFVLMTGILWFYALMTGFSAPVLRSVGMFNLILLAEVLNRRHDLINTLAASAFLILLLDPAALFTAGFQLSYLAVGGLALWQQPLYHSVTFSSRAANWLWEITTVALVAQLVTFPLGIYYFHQFPTYFWLANPWVIPLSSLVLILAMGLLAVCWLPGVRTAVGFLLDQSMWLLNQIVRRTEGLPNAVLSPLTLTGVELLLLGMLLVGLLLMVTQRRANRLWGILCISGLLSFFVFVSHLRCQKQRILVVHAVPKRSLINLIRGRTAELWHAGALNSHDPVLSFTVRGTWDSLGVPLRGVRLSPFNPAAIGVTVRVWEQKTFVVLEKGARVPRLPFPGVVDYLVITGNAVPDWRQISRLFLARTVILDDSNSPRIAARLRDQARQAGFQNIHWTREQGAFVARID